MTEEATAISGETIDFNGFIEVITHRMPPAADPTDALIEAFRVFDRKCVGEIGEVLS